MPNAESERPQPASGGDVAKRQIRGSTLLLAGRGIGALLNLAVQVLMVRHLSKSDYGDFAYAMALMMMGAHLVGLGLERGVSRFVPIYHERRQFGAMAGTIVLALIAILGCGAFAIAVLMALHNVLGPLLAPSPLAISLTLVLVCAAPLQAIDDVLVRLFAIFASPRALLFRRHLMTPSLRLAAVVALIAFQGDAFFLAVVWVLAGLAGLGISLAILFGVFRKQGLLAHFRPAELEIPARSVLRFSVPLLSTSGLLVARANLVVFLLGAFQSSVQVAALRAVTPLANLNQTIFDTFKLLYSPAASRLYARGDRSGINALYWRTASWIVLLSFPVLAATFAMAEPVAVLLLGAEYADSGTILAILSSAYFLNAAFGFNALTLQVFGQVRAIVAIDAATLVISVVTSLLLIPRYGALGGAIATCTSYVVQNALYQISLIRNGTLQMLDGSFGRVLTSVLAGTALVWVFAWEFEPPIAVGIAFAALVGLGVAALALPVLQVGETFPELERFALVRWLSRRKLPPLEPPQAAPGSSQPKEQQSL